MSSEMLKRRIALHERLTEELDMIADQLWRDYCEMFKVSRCYGVEKWDISGDKISLKIDTSRRGCYDY